MTEELLFCPFCGEMDVRLGGDGSAWFWECGCCFTTGPTGVDEESATIQWNRRAPVADEGAGE